MVSWGLIARKQEMTSVWVDGKYVPVTVLLVPQQEVVQWKTEDNDWYNAVVLWAEKKELKKEKWRKVSYSFMTEFRDLAFSDTWTPSVEQLQDIASVRISGVSKWKWFQWWMKRHNFAWGPASHGSKFHRALWSTGNRKPRRTIKWQKMAWRMWWDRVTLKSVPVVDVVKNGNEQLVMVKWSIPWSYNSFVTLSIV